MIKHVVAITLVAYVLPSAALAQTTRPADIGRYCAIVEKQIVALVETASSTNEDLAKFSDDQRAADPVKYAKVNELLASATASLKDKEMEWYHLGCVQIVYARPAGN